MDPGQLIQFKEQLEALERERLTDLAGEAPADASIAVDNAIGRLTRIEAIQAQAMGQAGRRRQEQRLRRALTRIAEGSYGTCTRWGREIPTGRLEVMPESGRCISCATRER